MLDTGPCAGTGPLGPGRGIVPDGKEHRPCPHLCHGGGSDHRPPGADGAGRSAQRALLALGGWALVLAALLVFARYHVVSNKQFGGITGDLAGWFLQKAELWMLAALCACQWGGLL